jgi:hypothetical protein
MGWHARSLLRQRRAHVGLGVPLLVLTWSILFEISVISKGCVDRNVDCAWTSKLFWVVQKLKIAE